jgi:hypothetical protein
MPISWKSPARFKPAVILRKIASARTINPSGGVTFSDFEWQECIPALHSMLRLPESAKEIDTSTLIWSALTRASEPLKPEDFLAAANRELSARLATKEEQFLLLMSISIKKNEAPAAITCLGTKARFLSDKFPRRYQSRDQLINGHQTAIPLAPPSYTRLIVSAKAKSPAAAFDKAMRSLDLQRAIWCLMANPRMQITLGSPSIKPINAIRLGGHHTLHHPDGNEARDGIWFEPGYAEAVPFSFSNPALTQKNSRWALSRIALSPYGNQIIDSLVRYVRALDEADANTAFLRLWTAVETLASPDVADYEKLVRRCAFLFQENVFHRQMLEHLREYRNSSIHAGEYSDHARTLCFQLQLYFSSLIWFHIRNATFFSSLEEANSFLDTPPKKEAIERQICIAQKALKFLR